MSVRESIKNVVEDYNCFGGHCPDCDDFLFTYVLSFNPPMVKQCCLGCDFERDISEEIKKAIGYNNEANPKVKVVEDYYRNATGYKRVIEDFIKPRNLTKKAKEQFDEMIEEPDPVQEYVDDLLDSIALSYPQINGTLNKSISREFSYWKMGTTDRKTIEVPGSHCRVCRTCGYMIPDNVTLDVYEYYEAKSRIGKKIISVQCPYCRTIQGYEEEVEL